MFFLRGGRHITSPEPPPRPHPVASPRYHEDYIPALIEKANCHAALAQWDMVVSTCQRALDLDTNCVPAHRLIVLHQLCRVGDYEEAARKLGDLIGSLDNAEAMNHKAYYQSAQFVSRLSGRHTMVLQQATTMLDRAMKITKEAGKEVADYLVESGFILTLSNAFHDAMNTYKRAMVLDETSVTALTGVILCQIQNEQLEEAAQQLEFLNEIQASLGRSTELGYLTALLRSKEHAELGVVIRVLDEAVDKQLSSLETQFVGVEYFSKTSPDLMLQMAKLYLQYGPSDAPDADHTPSPVLVKAQRALESLTKTAPGLIEGVYLLAKVKYLSGAIDAAKSGVQYCLNLDNTYAEGHLLMARINLGQGNTAAAAQSLEIGMSYNFEIKESPLYFSTKARIEQAEGKVAESIDTLKKAFKIARNAPAAGSTSRSKKKPITMHDRVTIYLEYSGALSQANKTHEAAKVMQDAMAEFKGTPEEMRVQIANADMSIKRGDVEEGLAILGAITPAQSYYVQAKQKMADIYLTHRKDKMLYAACYKELVDQNPTPHAYLLMGDAYMKIQDPEAAIVVYETALQKNPRDSVLARKIGSALVKTHNYPKAIDYYEMALKNGAGAALRGDLADLYIRLKRFDRAEKVLREGLETGGTGDLMMLAADVKLHMTSARLRTQTKDMQRALADLTEAKAKQADVLRRVEKEQPDMLSAQRGIMTNLCVMIAEIYQEQNTPHFDEGKAINAYQSALSYDKTSEDALMALSKLYLASNDLESAYRELRTLRQFHKDHTEAAMMLADIMYRKFDYDSAILHFSQLLDQKPEQYEALVYLIDLQRRNGKLAAVKKYLDKAGHVCQRADTEPGLNYTRGLYHWRCGEPGVAIKHFNKARRDSDWGLRSLHCMIEILLNPTGAVIGSEAFNAAAKTKEPDAKAMNTIKTLLDELAKMSPGSPRFKVLNAYHAMVSSKAGNAKNGAIEMFSAIVQEDKTNLGAQLGLAQCFAMAKALPKARAGLKQLLRLQWVAEEAEVFEGAWLLMADMYISQGKHPDAQEHLQKCLAHNKSCGKGWELMGKILEKDLAYVVSAGHGAGGTVCMDHARLRRFAAQTLKGGGGGGEHHFFCKTPCC